MPQFAVIGAGVTGLSTAIALLNMGHDVIIYAKNITPNTTSDVAAAIWMPYKVGPQAKALLWAKESFEKFKLLSHSTSKAGIFFKNHVELHKNKTEKPAWMEQLETIPIPDYLPETYKPHSHAVKILVIDTKKYMEYLTELCLKLGGEIIQTQINNINELFKTHSIVINCTGLGAKELVGDLTLYPIRGQVIVAEKIPGFNDSLVKPNDGLSHIITRSDDCLIGGTAEEMNGNLNPDETIREQIVNNAREIYPSLGKVKIIGEKVGLRPGRPAIRLEIEQLSQDHAIVHNYGHGGAGFAVSWGCATEAARLAHEFSQKSVLDT